MRCCLNFVRFNENGSDIFLSSHSTKVFSLDSVTSLNSLSDGRTPWPIPWLEAVFLPEFPNKGPVTEKCFTVNF